MFCKEHGLEQRFPTVAFPNAISGEEGDALWEPRCQRAAPEALRGSPCCEVRRVVTRTASRKAEPLGDLDRPLNVPTDQSLSPCPCSQNCVSPMARCEASCGFPGSCLLCVSPRPCWGNTEKGDFVVPGNGKNSWPFSGHLRWLSSDNPFSGEGRRNVLKVILLVVVIEEVEIET